MTKQVLDSSISGLPKPAWHKGPCQGSAVLLGPALQLSRTGRCRVWIGRIQGAGLLVLGHEHGSGGFPTRSLRIFRCLPPSIKGRPFEAEAAPDAGGAPPLLVVAAASALLSEATIEETETPGSACVVAIVSNNAKQRQATPSLSCPPLMSCQRATARCCPLHCPGVLQRLAIARDWPRGVPARPP